MFRLQIEEIKTQQRKLSKIQKRIKDKIHYLSHGANNAFKIHWEHKFPSSSYFISAAFDAGSLTSAWEPSVTLMLVNDDLIDANKPSRLTFDQIRSFCCAFTLLTGIFVHIRYIPPNKEDPEYYSTTNVSEEEAEL